MLDRKTESEFLQIPSEVLTHLIKAGLSGTEWAVVLAILQETTSQKAKTVFISLQEFHELVGLDEEAIRKGLKNLRSRNILIQESIPSFHRSASWRFNFDRASWNRVLRRHAPLRQHTVTAQGGVVREHTPPYAVGGREVNEKEKDAAEGETRKGSATLFIDINTNNNNKNKTTSQAGQSAEALSLADQLRTAVRIRDPRSRAARTENLSTWARDVELLIRIDKRTPEEIGRVIDWCQQPGGFWGPNILSGRKLREKFDTLSGQMLRADCGGKNGSNTNGSISNEAGGTTSERRTSRGDRLYIPRQ